MSPISNKVFGVIKHKCIANAVTQSNESSVETLQPGTMIHILPDHPGSECYFMIRDKTDWLDKYKTTIYKCSNNDCIVVTTELWPYLLALKRNFSRVDFIRKVYNQEFDMHTLKLGREIRIQWPTGVKVKYGEFMVTHNGPVKEFGKGYYIGLQLKNKSISLTAHLKGLSRHYRFGGTGILVPAYWVMRNIYKEDNRTESSATLEPDNSESNYSSMENIFEMVRNIRKTGATQNGKLNTPNVDEGTQNNIQKTGHDLTDNAVELKSNEDILKYGRSGLYNATTHCKCIVSENSDSTTNCLKCQKLSSQFEIAELKQELTNIPDDTSILVQCLQCEQKLKESLLQKCPQCTGSICFGCNKLQNGKPARCSFCKIQDDEAQISNITNSMTMVQPRDEISDNNLIQINQSDDQEISSTISENTDTCPVCYKNLSQKVILKNCGDVFCKECLQRTITTQQSNGSLPTCPICTKLIELDETTRKMFKTLYPALDSELIECRICQQIKESKSSIVLSNCGDSLCEDCVLSGLLNELANNLPPKCPVCHIQITSQDVLTLVIRSNTDFTRNGLDHNRLIEIAGHDETIETIINQTSSHDIQQQSESIQRPNYLEVCAPTVKNRLECGFCYQELDPECGVVLANCDDSLCRDCISNAFLQQIAFDVFPNCPICETKITDDEIRVLDPELYDSLVQNRLDEKDKQSNNMLSNFGHASKKFLLKKVNDLKIDPTIFGPDVFSIIY